MHLIRSEGEEVDGVEGVVGFESFRLRHPRAEEVGGEPVLTSITIESISSPARPITPDLLAALPTRGIAALVLASGRDGYWRSLYKRLVESPAVRPRGGSDAFSEEVATVVRAARLRGESTTNAVAARWSVSSDRANQYIREMKRRLGDRAPGDGRSERFQRPATRRAVRDAAPAVPDQIDHLTNREAETPATSTEAR